MKVEEDYGYIKIKLEDLIKENEISKNKLAHRAELQRTQLNQYCNGSYRTNYIISERTGTSIWN